MTDRYTLPSDTEAIKHTLPVLLAAVKAAYPGISDTDYMDLRLIYTELIINAIIHGNRCDSQKQVLVVVYYITQGLLSIVADEGVGFDYAAALLGADQHPLLESGRGLLLVRSLADGLAFNSQGNEIAFFKKTICLPSTCALS